MNFYTESFPESTRPQDLNLHLFGQALPAERAGRWVKGADVPLMVALPRTVSPS